MGASLPSLLMSPLYVQALWIFPSIFVTCRHTHCGTSLGRQSCGTAVSQVDESGIHCVNIRMLKKHWEGCGKELVGGNGQQSKE